jgi:hypothetical protein
MKILEDLTGQVFGKLTVQDYYGKDKFGKRLWYCICSCGSNKKVITCTSNLKRDITKSCGCHRTERIREESYKIRRYNKYDLTNDYGVGYTYKNQIFYFDLIDYELIKDYSWHLSQHGYVASFINNKYIFMHDFIMPHDKDKEVDHINHVHNDNRRDNLRIVTRCQNGMNKKIHSNNTSGVTGVYWVKRQQKWFASITAYKKKYNLGYFSEFQDAVVCRKEAEKQLFKEFQYKGDERKL